MPITNTDLKNFAAALAVPTSDETQLRASISRAYYCAFHSVLPFAAMLPRSASCPADIANLTHWEVSERIREWRTQDVHPKLAQMTATKGQISRSLDTARANRVRADYRLSDNISVQDAAMQVERARAVMRAMAQVEAMIGGAGVSATGAESSAA